MAKKFSSEPDLPSNHRDDLQLIHGIGPGIEKRLNAAGISRYSQLASMTPSEVEASIGPLVGLTVKRIQDQDWIEQAKKLQPADDSGVKSLDTNWQPYASFKLELLLDEENTVRRTKLIYIQGNTEQTWAGWNEKLLCASICQHAKLSLPVSDSQGNPDPPSEEIQATASEDESSSVKPIQLSGTPQLKQTSITSLHTNFSGRIHAANQPLKIDLSIDPEGMIIPEDSELAYQAIVDAKELGTHVRVNLGEEIGVFKLGEQWHLEVKCKGLKQGTYRLKTGLSLKMAHEELPSPQVNAEFDGGLLRIY